MNLQELKLNPKERLCALDGAWIAVYVKTGWEQSVAKQLSAFGYERYLPVRLSPNRLARGQHKEVPLFPGYVFCRYQAMPTFRIMRAYGVLQLVGHTGLPIPIPDTEIESIQRVLDSGLYSEPWKFLTAGQRVRVEGGPLRGVEGTLISIKSGSGSRLIVGINMLERFVAVDIAGSEIVPLFPSGQRSSSLNGRGNHVGFLNPYSS